MRLSGAASLLRTCCLSFVDALTLFWSLLRVQAEACVDKIALLEECKFFLFCLLFVFSCERVRDCFTLSTFAKREA